ncbi:SDR family NAD(P)-dependent oxidoreductase [Agrobacterium pusense]|uniref:SDR family NAD(P)-dependent oxidoreductase n=1 Tax=Agrobacterium pusense TaxID=648995 RepID=UPI003FD40AEE
MTRTIVITGASDGIGAEAARQLSRRGDTVVVVGRSREKTEAIATEIGAPCHLADYTDLSQVRRLAEDLLSAYPRIDVLANNAGGLFKPEITPDGFDKTFQVNHLGGFLLTHMLLERLIASRAKVIQTSSIGARFLASGIDIDKFTDRTAKNTFTAYGNTKLANQLFTKELHRRYHAKGLSAVSFHPGNIASSFGDRSYTFVKLLMRSPVGWLLEKPQAGGARLAGLANGDAGKDWKSGEYYENNQIPSAWKINPQARDTTLAEALWDRTEDILGLRSISSGG